MGASGNIYAHKTRRKLNVYVPELFVPFHFEPRIISLEFFSLEYKLLHTQVIKEIIRVVGLVEVFNEIHLRF